MKIYNYHPQTNVFIGTGFADQDPLEENNFLIPAYATTVEPPSFGPDSQAVFENGGWRIESIPKPEAEKQPTPEEIQAAENKKARAYLNSTDWYVVRKMETGVEIPEDISAARVAARLSIVE